MTSKKEIIKMIVPFPMTDHQQATVRHHLSRITDVTNAVFQEEVDPTLIGGIIIICGEKYIDCSLKTQLLKIRESILKEG